MIFWRTVPVGEYRAHRRWLWLLKNKQTNKSLWDSQPFTRSYISNNQPTNNLYRIYKLFCQELFKVFLPNSFLVVKKHTKFICVVLMCFVSCRLCTLSNLWSELCDLVGVHRQLGDWVWVEVVGLCRLEEQLLLDMLSNDMRAAQEGQGSFPIRLCLLTTQGFNVLVGCVWERRGFQL